MQSGYTGHITSVEWRWVISVAAGLILLAFLPFLWVILIGSANTDYEFMGALHDYQNGAAYIANIFQGGEGRWVTQYLYTPEPHPGTFFNILYTLIGQLSRVTFLPGIVLFHIARVAASLFMYLTLYQLAASIWMRVRTRRIFFIFVVVGSGLGWLFGPIMGDSTYLDLTAPEAYPFYATLVNVHFPLTIACLALLASGIIPIFRPGKTEEPGVSNEAVPLFILGLVVVLVYPIALVPLIAAFIIQLGIFWYNQRKVTLREARWLMWFIVPSLPIFVYYGATLAYRPVVSEVWSQVNASSSPLPLVFLLSVGLPLVIAAPGLLRAVRRFEPDGDQFMLIWLLVMIALVYLPTTVQRHFVIGLMIPIAYFATRATEDTWFKYVQRRWRFRVFAAGVPLIGASLVLTLVLPALPFVAGNTQQASGMLLERDYSSAFNWLRPRVGSNDVILAAPNTATWIPATTGARVVYGHPTQTLDSATKIRAVRGWYGEQDIENCMPLLQGEQASLDETYVVRFVILGPQENRFGNTVCIDLLEPVATFDAVTVYRYSPDLMIIR